MVSSECQQKAEKGEKVEDEKKDDDEVRTPFQLVPSSLDSGLDALAVDVLRFVPPRRAGP